MFSSRTYFTDNIHSSVKIYIINNNFDYEDMNDENKHDYLVIFQITLPIIGLIAFLFNVWWLFYITGGIIAFYDIYNIIKGNLRFYATLFTLGLWIFGFFYTKSIIKGLLLGSCISTFLPCILICTPFVFLIIIGLIRSLIKIFIFPIHFIANKSKLSRKNSIIFTY